MPLIMRSTRSGSTGRLRRATSTERCSLSRSKGTRRPERLTTISSRSCTRSKVVKRPPQSGQTRRRRMAEASSVGRESFTCVSRLAAIGAAHAAASALRRRSGTGGSARAPAALTAASTAPLPSSPFLRQPVEHLDDQLADPAGTRRRRSRASCRPACRGGCRRSPSASPGSNGHAVLVAGDVGAAERRLGGLAGELLRPEVDQHAGGCRCRRRRCRSPRDATVSASALAFSTTARA